MPEFNHEDGVKLAKALYQEHINKPLTDLQIAIIRGSLQNKSYQTIVDQDCPHNLTHAKEVGSKLFQEFSTIFKETITKKNFKAIIEQQLQLYPWRIKDTALEQAIIANNRGFDHYQAGDFIAARKEFELAITLNPDHAASYYNLGWLHEQVRNFDSAIKFYQEAALRGFAAAYCNLARLYILESQNYIAAVSVSKTGLQLLKFPKSDSEQIVKAALLTYLAWAWVQQQRYQDALPTLEAALKLDKERAVTHGLKAQVLEALGRQAEAMGAWQLCLEYAQPNQRDDDLWRGMAQQQLRDSA